MEAAIGVGAARWVVDRVLEPITIGLLEPWAASSALGTKIHDLKLELLYAQGMLDNARGRDVRSPALAQLLLELRQLAYIADDVIDELEYFRIQDELNGTYETMDPEGLKGLLVHAEHTVKTHARWLKLPSCSWPAACHGAKEQDGEQGCLSGACGRFGRNAQDAEGGCMAKVASSIRAVGKRLPSNSLPCTSMLDTSCLRPSSAQEKKHIMQSPALKFDRVGMSKKMSDIVEQLKPICAKVSTILGLELFGFNRTTTPETPFVRPKTTSEIIEPKICGRDDHIEKIVGDITVGKYTTKDLTVLPIFGQAGIGKTTFTRHIYNNNEVKTLFDIPIWISVSHNFNANILTQEILKKIPREKIEKVHDENGTDEEKIEKVIKTQKFLLVLDDMWRCPENEWRKVLTLLRKGGRKGNMVIVTTRFVGVAEAVESKDCSFKLDHLEHEDSMGLFQACVFGEHQTLEDHDGLLEIGEEIVKMLKGSPLAIKTVGRLLRSQRSVDHWISVLESKEWEIQTSDEDIMPALTLSYNYLPFPVQQCFSYCGLFPEYFKFKSEQLIHLWIGLGLLRTSDQNKRLEFIGQSYLDILVDHDFFEKVEGPGEVHTHYVIHDLLHELAVKVSSYECLSINSSNARAIKIPASIRHLSIFADITVVTDKTSFKNFRSDLATLGKTLKAENLHTLMLFGKYHGSFVNTLRELFRKAKALRVIYIYKPSYHMEDLLPNFKNFVHLRYLCFRGTSLPSISRLYHLMVLDIEECCNGFTPPPHMSNLVKLRHYIGQGDALHLVGKLRFLQELRRFEVRKETNGFELEQLGQLLELRGSLGIYNLENVQSIEEVEEAKLAQKTHLHKLKLVWGKEKRRKKLACGGSYYVRKQMGVLPYEKIVLENLKPHRNLRALCISGNRGDTYPSWLHTDLHLEELKLKDVYWNELPLLGKLCLGREHGGECRGCVTFIRQGFQNLKTLKLVHLPTLKKWCGEGTSNMLSNLEKLVVRGCCELIELPFSRSTCHEPRQVENMAWFPKLRKIEIKNCPNLLPLPPIPWTSTLRHVEIVKVGSDFEKLTYSNGVSLDIKGNDGRGSTFWNVLAFENLTKLKTLKIENCTAVPWHHLELLTSLKKLHIVCSSHILLPTERVSNVPYKFPVKRLTIERCSASGKQLTQMLSHFPYLSMMSLHRCHRVSGLGVAAEEQPGMPSASANKMEESDIGEEEIEATAEGVVLLPPHIKRLNIDSCPRLSRLSSSIREDTLAGRGLQDLHSLQVFQIIRCPLFLSSNFDFHFLFPTSLQTLCLQYARTSLTLPPLPNLTELCLHNLRGLRGEEFLPLLTQGQLTKLTTSFAPNFFVGLEAARLKGIRTLQTEDIAGFLVMPICKGLSSSLTNLCLRGNPNLERFTTDQEESLHKLTFLEVLEFRDYPDLQSGPAGLSALHRLKKLKFWICPSLQSLPNDSIPSSLDKLTIVHCKQFRSLPMDGLQKCSLRELVVGPDPHVEKEVVIPVQEELAKQCRKLKGKIPVFTEHRC